MSCFFCLLPWNNFSWESYIKCYTSSPCFNSFLLHKLQTPYLYLKGIHNMILLNLPSSLIYHSILKLNMRLQSEWTTVSSLNLPYSFLWPFFIHVLPMRGIFIPAPFFIQIIPTKMICESLLDPPESQLDVPDSNLHFYLTTHHMSCLPVFCISTWTKVWEQRPGLSYTPFYFQCQFTT